MVYFPGEDFDPYPLPPAARLRSTFIGKSLTDLPTPAIVLDRGKVRRNCEAMINAMRAWGVGWRAHVKSHKTLELSKMQVPDQGPVHFVVSTLIEAEGLAEWVKGRGEGSSILYGIPCPPSTVPRLLALAQKLAPAELCILVDNTEAFHLLHGAITSASTTIPILPIGIFIKLDTGYHRAGLPPDSSHCVALVEAIVKHSTPPATLNSSSAPSTTPTIYLRGFYSHYGHSYAGSSPSAAASGLLDEFSGVSAALAYIPPSYTRRLTLSVGATPTATAAQTLLHDQSEAAIQLRARLEELRGGSDVEFHAGVYPLLDLQQVATHARPSVPPSPSSSPSETATFAPLNKDTIAIRLLAEITSIYPLRSPPEALIAAGSLALGREPCKSYSGWGVVTSDLANSGAGSVYEEGGERKGWLVGRVSQEHGVLVWEGESGDAEVKKLRPGVKVMIWPNHACVAGAGFGWYFVVDGGEEVVDVWVRWRGW